jgi:hypothetical protein
MTAQEYISLVSADKSKDGQYCEAFYQLSDMVEAMSHADRIALRSELEKLDEKRLIRNLYYDYKRQSWI